MQLAQNPAALCSKKGKGESSLQYKNVSYFCDDGPIALLTLNRPESLNALNYQTMDELEHVLKQLRQTAHVSGLIITGSGRAFVAGADLKEILKDGIEENRRYAARAQSIFNQIEQLPFPVVAAVNGYALGGGCELAMACDIRIAGEKAKFGMPEVSLGVIPCFGGTQRLPALVGKGIAKELIFTGKTISADEALRIGLVNHVVEQGKLISFTEDLLNQICKKSSSAIQYAKLAIDRGSGMSLLDGQEYERELSALCYGHPHKAEGFSAFFEKRTPLFTR